MKQPIHALIATLALTSLPGFAMADISFNVGGVTDYRYRGISQSRLNPALQGGLDFSAGGFYLGAWGSSIKWIKDASGGNASAEIDLYGGYKGELAKGFSYDVGLLTYQYPSNKLNPKAETTELYAAVTYGVTTLKYSHAVTNTFANPDSKNSYYLDISATFDLGFATLTPHIGYQGIKGPLSEPASYTDYSLTLSKDISGLVLSLAVVGTDASKTFYASPVNGKALGKSALVLGAKYNF